jgi:hypothetical protein
MWRDLLGGTSRGADVLLDSQIRAWEGRECLLYLFAMAMCHVLPS